MKNQPLDSPLRHFLTEFPRQTVLLRDPATWYQIVACLDVIGDAEVALDAFVSVSERPSRGEWYLAIYGVLQALVLQQDAVSHLACALKLSYQPDPQLLPIRELRNDAAGHPTRRGGAPGRSFSALARITLSREGFTLLTTSRDPYKNDFRKVELLPPIAIQREIIAKTLANFLAALRTLEGLAADGD